MGKVSLAHIECELCVIDSFNIQIDKDCEPQLINTLCQPNSFATLFPQCMCVMVSCTKIQSIRNAGLALMLIEVGFAGQPDPTHLGCKF